MVYNWMKLDHLVIGHDCHATQSHGALPLVKLSQDCRASVCTMLAVVALDPALVA